MEIVVAQRRCFLAGDESAERVLLQPVDARGSRAFEKEADAIRAAAPGRPFLLCGFPIESWNDDLSPWAAPPAFRGSGFGGGAAATLEYLAEELIPRLCGGKQVFLGGYSMAGLFSLWAATEYGGFAGVAGVSPSLWFPGWPGYARGRAFRAGSVYLSLGDREASAAVSGGAASGECIRELDKALAEAGTSHLLEWNAGGHFSDPTGRTVRGFAWLLNR